MPTLNAFIESLTNEHDKRVQMGSMRSSKDQALFARGPNALNVKGKQNKEKTKFDPHKKKEKSQQSDEPSGSREKKQRGKENTNCSYCGRRFHPKISCMKNNIDQMTLLLENNNITLPSRESNKGNGDRNDNLERGHALMESI